MINFQGNVLAAVDVETTGTVDGYHEIVQVAVVPLTDDIEPSDDMPPFYMKIKPDYPERAEKMAMQVNGLNLDELKFCPDRWEAADLFDDWFENLKLPMYKKLIYLTQNAPFDIPFLKQWLGVIGFSKYFTPRGRDTMFTATAYNDYATWRNMPIPFNRVGLKELCEYFGVDFNNHHDALSDCLATARVYKELLRLEL